MWRPGCGDRTHPSWPASRTTVWCSTPARSFPGSSTSSSGRYGPRSMARAVFLDRDGTILEDPGFLHQPDRKSTRLNSSHGYISYAVFCLKKKKKKKWTKDLLSACANDIRANTPTRGA